MSLRRAFLESELRLTLPPPPGMIITHDIILVRIKKKRLLEGEKLKHRKWNEKKKDRKKRLRVGYGSLSCKTFGSFD